MHPSPITPARRQFERTTLKRLAAAGATPDELASFRALLIKGRKTPADDRLSAHIRAAEEKAGIEFAVSCLKGDPPDSITIHINPFL